MWRISSYTCKAKGKHDDFTTAVINLILTYSNLYTFRYKKHLHFLQLCNVQLSPTNLSLLRPSQPSLRIVLPYPAQWIFSQLFAQSIFISTQLSDSCIHAWTSDLHDDEGTNNVTSRVAYSTVYREQCSVAWFLWVRSVEPNMVVHTSGTAP